MTHRHIPPLDHLRYAARRIAVLILIAVPSAAQQTEPLTLERCIQIALKESKAVQTAMKHYISSKKSSDAAAMVSAPTVDLDLRLPAYDESLTSQFNPLNRSFEFYQLQSTTVQSTLSINQPIWPTGGTLSLSGDVFGRKQLSGSSGASDIRQDYFSSFQVSFQQPFFSPNLLKIAHEGASIRADEATASYRGTMADIVYRVTIAFYYAYRSTQQEAISRELVKQNEDSYETAKGKYGSGLIPEVELLQSEVDLATSRNQALNDQRDAASGKNALKVLLGLPLEAEVELKAELAYVPVAIAQKEAIGKALENRTELLNARRDIRLRELEVDQASSQRHIRVGLSASYGISRNDVELAGALRDFGRNRGVGLSVSLPLFDWGRHSLEVEAAEAMQKSAVVDYDLTEQQIRQEIIDLLSQIEGARSRIEVLAKTVEVANKSYDISLERFRAGTITQNDLAQSRQRLTTAKLNDLSALIDYRVGLADLLRKTLWDFEKNAPVEFEMPAE